MRLLTRWSDLRVVGSSPTLGVRELMTMWRSDWCSSIKSRVSGRRTSTRLSLFSFFCHSKTLSLSLSLFFFVIQKRSSSVFFLLSFENPLSFFFLLSFENALLSFESALSFFLSLVVRKRCPFSLRFLLFVQNLITKYEYKALHVFFSHFFFFQNI